MVMKQVEPLSRGLPKDPKGRLKVLSSVKARILALLLLLSLPALGCVGLPRVHQEVALTSLVKKAYRAEPGTPKSSQYARHFERGWKQAYYDVSRGADGCPPSVPPESYWSIKYQNPEGCRRIAAWFEGYECGVLAAQRDGRQLFADVPIGEICSREDSGVCNPVSEIRHPSKSFNGIAAPSSIHFNRGDLLAVEPDDSAEVPASFMNRLPPLNGH